MRIGVLTGGSIEDLEWAKGLEFQSVEWMRFHSGPAGPGHTDWKPFAERFAADGRNAQIARIRFGGESLRRSECARFAHFGHRRVLSKPARPEANRVRRHGVPPGHRSRRAPWGENRCRLCRRRD